MVAAALNNIWQSSITQLAGKTTPHSPLNQPFLNMTLASYGYRLPGLWAG